MTTFNWDTPTGSGVFVSQSPVETDVLFKNFPGFIGNLKMIAAHIAQPAATGTLSRPMAFGLYGRWGAGKSTAMHHLRTLVTEHLADSGGSVTMSYYSAPQWEGTPNARATLSYSILSEIDPEAVFYAVRDHDNPVIDDDHWQPGNFVRLAQMFDASPALYQQWMDQIASKLHPDGGERRSHVVFIDDIDRCTGRFTAELLAATSIWNHPDHVNIFFVIAASEKHLLEALEANLPLGAHTAEQALEKYVHLSVTVPRMLSNAPQVADYLIHLWQQVETPTATHREDLETMIRDSGATYPDCVMAPLLAQEDPRYDDDWLTPRSVKHRFNAFLAEFQPHGEHLDPLNVKRWVVKAFWPEFWWKRIWPLESATILWDEIAADVDRLRKLIDVGEKLLPLQRMGDDQLRASLDHLLAQADLVQEDVDPSLAIYLASEPRFPLPEPGDSAPIAGGRVPVDPRSPEPLPMEAPKPAEASAPTASDEAEASAETAIMLKRFQAEQARDDGRTDEAREHLQGVVELAHHPELRDSAAPAVGNVALIAETVDMVDVARALHLRAHELDPAHSNVAQNLVQFIIDAQQDDLYGIVPRLLEQLRGPGAHHKPSRTRGLAAQFAVLTAEPAERRQPIENLLRWAQEERSGEALARLLTLSDRDVDHDAVRELARAATEHDADDDAERYGILRMLADFLSKSDDPADEREAIDLYSFLMRTGLACRDGSRRSSDDVAHNMATLYMSLDRVQAALDIWSGIYRSGPMKERMRRNFAVALNQADQDRAATAVLQGHPLPPLDLTPEPLPESFSPETDRWWELVPIDSYAPCPMPSARQPALQPGELRDGASSEA